MADFVLGRIKFVWKGDWSGSTAYLADDVVKYGGNAFIAVVNHTSSSAFETDLSANPTKWQKMVGGIDYKTDYANATFYKVDDIVKYGPSLWRCTTAHTSSSAVLDTTKFAEFLPGLEFEDSWASGTQYQQGDIVTYGGYQYVAERNNIGVTPVDSGADWEVITTGFSMKGVYSSGTAYKTGEVVQYGGNTYVCKVGHSAGAYLPTNTTYYDLLVEGISLQGDFATGTAYKIGEVVIFLNSSYRAKVDRAANGTSPTNLASNAVWELYNKGDASGVFTQRGDLVKQGVSIPERFPLGPKGARLVSTGTDLVYSEVNINNTYHVAPNGNDENPGSEDLPLATIRHALELCNSNGITQIDTIAGGTGGTPGTFNNVSGTGGSGSLATFNVTTDGSSTPQITIVNSGTGFAKGNTITIAKANVGTSTADITFKVENISEGDKVFVHQGQYQEIFPIIVPNKATLEGASLRGCVVKPFQNDTGNFKGREIATVSHKTGGTGGTPGTFNRLKPTTLYQNYTVASAPDATTLTVSLGISPIAHTYVSGGQIVKTDGTAINITNAPYNGTTGVVTITTASAHGLSASDTVGLKDIKYSCATGEKTYPKLGSGAIFDVTTDGSSNPSVTLYHGGHNYRVNQVLQFATNTMGSPSAAYEITVATQQANSSCNFFHLNNATNIRNFSFKGGSNGAVIMSLDPSGAISSASPYIQNCTNVHTSAVVTGIKIDGDVQASGNKSILANDFTQIINDGRGVHVLNRGRAELVSVFTYYNDKAFFAESGGFIRALNSSMAYGEYGAYADGTDPDETVVAVTARGQMLQYSTNLTSGQTIDIGDVVRGQTSNAYATVIGHVADKKFIQIDTPVGNFSQNETIQIENTDSTFFTNALTSGFGDSVAANQGQIGKLFRVDSSDGTLGTAGKIVPGRNIKFAGDSTIYAVTAVTDEDTTNQRATIRLTPEKTVAVADNAAITITANFSNIRLTGHDFLDIGTGDLTSTNYPNVPSQLADQGREVTELNGGRIYWTSTDQDGDFRVGDLFRVEQSTGVATLNADAFDLSGLTELQLGSIGAQIGATINEFSTDGTLSGNSDVAVPTEQAVRTFVLANSFSTGKAIAMSIVFG